ncbi:MAG: hypothetical protein HQK62_12495 [Desulfamplus sp.]|nr:hypothetical protein [Desulfamplus sp.]
MKLKDMSIGFKMGSLATLMILLLLVVGWQGFNGIKTASLEAAKLENI